MSNLPVYRPYSYKVPGTDQYVSYIRMEPMSLPLAVMADMAEFSKYGVEDKLPAEVLDTAFAAIIGATQDKAFMQGLTTLTNIFADPERFASTAATQVLKPLPYLPWSSLVNRLATAEDPYARDTRVNFSEDPQENATQQESLTFAAWTAMANKWKARIPSLLGFAEGGRQSLPPLLDVMGKPVESGSGSFIYDFASPIWSTRFKDSTVGQELRRLEYTIKEPPPHDHPQRFIGRTHGVRTAALFGNAGARPRRCPAV